jgi:hypothetical protein
MGSSSDDSREAAQAGEHLPWVTCLCPTFGRVSFLRDAVSCFLSQRYPHKRLLILNDAARPLSVAADLGAQVRVLNAPEPFANLGAKRRALLDAADTELVAHWDDDDLYLPWHLSRSVAALLREEVDCVKSSGGWFMSGALRPSQGAPRTVELGAILQVPGIRHNVFEGTMLFRREAALGRGGYPELHSGQAKALLDAFARAKRLFVIPDREPAGASGEVATTVSYVYRWSQGVGHISAIGNGPDALARFSGGNRDLGDGSPIDRTDLAPYWPALLACARSVLPAEDAESFVRRMGESGPGAGGGEGEGEGEGVGAGESG